jgi:hypothetical protein
MAKRRRNTPSVTLHQVKDLLQDAQNANKGTTRGRAMVESSLRRYGFGRSVLADKHGRLIAGNKTVAAAAGDAKVVVVKTQGKELVVVQRTDLDLNDAEAQELGIADNRAGELGLEWNVPTLQVLEQTGVDMKQFFRSAEWDALVTENNTLVAPGEVMPEMALQPFEEYNYLMIVFRNSQDWQGACDQLGVHPKVAVTIGGARKVGLGRVLDGSAFLERLCKSSSPAGNGSTRSKRTRSASSRTRRSASRKVKPPPIAASPAASSSTPTP